MYHLALHPVLYLLTLPLIKHELIAFKNLHNDPLVDALLSFPAMFQGSPQ